MIPPDKNIIVAKSILSVAVLVRSNPNLTNKNADTTVANTSKKSFYPKMHNPPSPIFSNSKIGLATPHQSGSIK